MSYILIILITLFFIFLAGGLFVVEYAMTRRDRTELFKSSTVAPSGRLLYKEQVQNGVNWFEAQPFETLTITSKDGLLLKALLLSPSHPTTCVVALHGFRSWPSREYAGVAKLLYDNGIAVLYPYQRSHRESAGRYITFGVKEKYDCAQWADVLAAKYPNIPMFLYGQSMGGATVLMSGTLNLPEQVKGIIADSAYNSPADVIINLLKTSYHIPAYPLIWFIDIWTMLIARYELFHNTAIKGMQKKYKYLFIHGTDDNLVPYEMGKTNYSSCPSQNKKMLTVDNAGHCACCYKEKTVYDSELIKFITEIN